MGGDIGPGPTNPVPVWTKHLEYPFDFPSGVNYTVGASRWTTDWNYVQPVVNNFAGGFSGSTSTINFNLPAAPSGSGSLYLALASDFQGPLIIKVNGTDIAGSLQLYGYNLADNASSFGSFTNDVIVFAGQVANRPGSQRVAAATPLKFTRGFARRARCGRRPSALQKLRCR